MQVFEALKTAVDFQVPDATAQLQGGEGDEHDGGFALFVRCRRRSHVGPGLKVGLGGGPWDPSMTLWAVS